MNKKWFFLIIMFMTLSCGMLMAQSANKKADALYRKAQDALNGHHFDKAQTYLDKALELDPNFAEAYLLQGDVYNFQSNSVGAVANYNKAIQLKPNQKPILFYITAVEELKCGLYQDAYNHLLIFQEREKDITPLAKEFEKAMETATFGKEAIKNPMHFNPINMGPNINSEHDEYLAALTADEQEIIFTVRQPRNENTICVFCQTEEDFYVSKQVNNSWQPREAMGAPIKSGYNEGAQCISPDGRYLFYTLCNTDYGMGSCDLYWAKRIGDRWSRPRNFGEPVNSKHWESQPTIAPDGRTIIFASNRPGGFGGVDLWKTTMTEEGVFSVPENLGPVINTKGDDTAPFIHSDGKTLYFCSDGRPGMGGKDIYYSTLLSDGSWSEPLNMGYPLNTPADEINISINAAGNTGYIASDKEGGFGGLDLYSFTLDEKLRPTPVTYLKGRVIDAFTKRPVEAQIEMIDLNQDKLLTSTTSDPETGEFLACILTGTNVLLNVSNPLYPFYSENFQIDKEASEIEPYIKDISLQRAGVGKTYILQNIFFEFDKSDLQPASFVELNLLVDYLKQNHDIAIEIGGHTDDQGSDEYNNRLSLARAKAVYDYLLSKGIEASQVSYKGYGKSQPIADNSTEEGRATNRRTEFKIVEVGR
ncbi:MAG: OmpA family protein [Bacteroidales bacterium]|nr:OmpA family protein [Bacteroidales bacterium]